MEETRWKLLIIQHWRVSYFVSLQTHVSSRIGTPTKFACLVRRCKNPTTVVAVTAWGASTRHALSIIDMPLRHFVSWNTTAPEGTPEYYSQQVYKHGAKCWNGPERSITVLPSSSTSKLALTTGSSGGLGVRDGERAPIRVRTRKMRVLRHGHDVRTLFCRCC